MANNLINKYNLDIKRLYIYYIITHYYREKVNGNSIFQDFLDMKFRPYIHCSQLHTKLK